MWAGSGCAVIFYSPFLAEIVDGVRAFIAYGNFNAEFLIKVDAAFLLHNQTRRNERVIDLVAGFMFGFCV
jgi:hypothetical protein